MFLYKRLDCNLYNTVTPKFRRLTPFSAKNVKNAALAFFPPGGVGAGGALSNCDFWGKREREKIKRGKERQGILSHHLCGKGRLCGTALEVSFSGQTTKNGEGKSKQSHLLK